MENTICAKLSTSSAFFKNMEKQICAKIWLFKFIEFYQWSISKNIENAVVFVTICASGTVDFFFVLAV